MNKQTLCFVNKNLIDAIWNDKPAQPANPVYIHPLKYSGQPASEKIAKLRNYIETQAASAYLLTDLSEIAWLFNLRGSDFADSPLFYAYALVTPSEIHFYVNSKQLDTTVSNYLKEDLKCTLHEYAEIFGKTDWNMDMVSTAPLHGACTQ